MRLAVKVVPPSDVYSVRGSEALRTWWYVSPTRWSGIGQRLASCEQRQAILAATDLCFCWHCLRDLQGSHDILKVNLLVFLE